MSNTMSILAPLPIKTQCDVIRKIKKLGFKEPDITVFQEPWYYRFCITVAEPNKNTTLYVSYKKFCSDRRLEK